MIRFDDVSKVYDDSTVAVDGLSLDVPTGSLLALVGPSGCGKTTSLRMVNRLVERTSGTITLDGLDITTVDRIALRRKIGYVIQHAGLFPHRTVVDNVAALPRLLGGDRRATRHRALELLELVGLDAKLARRYPWQLSGGQQQRVGVARALATDPPYLLMDEPFSAVDPIVRGQLQDEFVRLQRDLGKTIMLVTHDIDEALKLGDRVAVLRQGGVLAQLGTPDELLTDPRDGFVADFVGSARGYRALSFRHLDSFERVVPAPTVAVREAGAPGDGAADGVAAGVAARWRIAVDGEGRALGWVDTEAHPVPAAADVDRRPPLLTRHADLRALLDGALASPEGRVALVDDEGHPVGIIAAADLVERGRLAGSGPDAAGAGSGAHAAAASEGGGA